MHSVVFSGVQPTGDLHLGNYLGAIRQFVPVQDQPDTTCFYCIVDLHAVTAPYDRTRLAHQSRTILAAYLAAGLDASRVTIFRQSAVPAHTELAWLLNCVARMGWMERMTQFKDKTGENQERASVGLFTYPVLMAADILAYRATHVPVGADQKQHLELARDIAKKFNKDFSGDLPLPRPITSPIPRVMSLQVGTNKMSKSDPDPNSRINMMDSDDEIVRKVRKATADIQPFPSVLDDSVRLEVQNLIELYGAVTGEAQKAILRQFGGRGYGEFKPVLAEAIIAMVAPVREAMANILAMGEDYLDGMLAEHAAVARETADANVAYVKERMGF